MIYAKGRNRFLLCIIALVMVVCTLFTMVHPTVAHAAEREISYDKTNVLEDLTSSTVNGEPSILQTILSTKTKKLKLYLSWNIVIHIRLT